MPVIWGLAMKWQQGGSVRIAPRCGAGKSQRQI
ncbi:hypothetical protein EPYR_02377 [Erwinia pyrifoliae DSM 12163]|nr:hypothetical protein EPYR_02377 [Erwinia pyrifoliae DSM 12163]